MALLLVGASGGSLPAHAEKGNTGIVTIRVSTWPALLAIDPGTHQVYVRTMGMIDRYGNPGTGAGYTLLDGTTGKVLRVWPDIPGVAPAAFVSTDNGLLAVVPPSSRAMFTPIPNIQAMSAQVGASVTINLQGGAVADRQGKLVALVTYPAGQFGHIPTFTLWVFVIKSAHLLGRTTLPQTSHALSVAFDAAANRVLVAYLNSVQLFTLNGLHYLATIPDHGYQPAQCNCTWYNRLYDSEPVAVDTSLGRAMVVSGVGGPGTAQILDLKSGKVLRTLGVGVQPINVQVDTTLHRAYILDSSCGVNILDLRSERLVANVTMPPGPLGLAVDEPTGKVFVTQGVSPGHVIMFPANTTLNQSSC